MKKICAFIISVLIMTGVSVFAYTDTENSAYKEEIDELTKLGIISGFEDSTFKPYENVTRAQAAKMFAVVKGFSDKPEDYAYISQKKDFSDLNSNHWAFKYVNFLTGEKYHVDDNGNEVADVRVIDGFEDGSFRPDENVTLVQLIKMAVACSGDFGYEIEAKDEGGYPDGYIKTAAKYGFSKGIDIQDINAHATREQAAKIISNTLNVPLRITVKRDLISDDHEVISDKVIANFDGSNKNFARVTFKDILTKGNDCFSIETDVSPLDGETEFFVYGQIDSISGNDITINLAPATLINSDGSIYNCDDKLTVGVNGFKLNKGSNYYFRIKKQDNKWIIDNYAVL